MVTQLPTRLHNVLKFKMISDEELINTLDLQDPLLKVQDVVYLLISAVQSKVLLHVCFELVTELVLVKLGCSTEQSIL